MPKHPLAEVFGFPTTNLSPEVERYRKNKLCPYNNKVPSCTKDKAENPLGVCSVYVGNDVAITCPVRFRQDWLIAEDAAAFFFPEVASFDLTLTSVKALLRRENLTLREQALRTIVKNRVNRGGILAPGAGLLKEGENGRGIRSRWYPETLQKRILEIAAIRERITFILGNGMDILRQHAQRNDAVFFIDPPYTAGSKNAGSRLYTYAELDHEELFHLTSMLRGEFLMTYDDDPDVRALARQYGFDTCAVAMKNTHHARMTELLIGRNLDWLTGEKCVISVEGSSK